MKPFIRLILVIPTNHQRAGINFIKFLDSDFLSSELFVINPKLGTYFLHSLHGQFFGFHPLITFLKAATLSIAILPTLKVQYPRF